MTADLLQDVVVDGRQGWAQRVRTVKIVNRKAFIRAASHGVVLAGEAGQQRTGRAMAA